MKVGLFIPCYVDQLYPEVAWSTLRLMERLGIDCTIPEAPSCCGQPLKNSGHEKAALPLVEKFHAVFAGFDFVVSPSGSCVSHLKEHPSKYGAPVLELSEFLHDVVQVESLGKISPRRVVLHRSCHGARALCLGGTSETRNAPPCKVSALLRRVEGLTLVEPEKRRDECCGFGGSFSVKQSEISVAMGQDRADLFLEAGAEVVTATDSSCLAHLEGVFRKRGLPLRTLHVAQLFAGDP